MKFLLNSFPITKLLFKTTLNFLSFKLSLIILNIPLNWVDFFLKIKFNLKILLSFLRQKILLKSNIGLFLLLHITFQSTGKIIQFLVHFPNIWIHYNLSILKYQLYPLPLFQSHDPKKHFWSNPPPSQNHKDRTNSQKVSLCWIC